MAGVLLIALLWPAAGCRTPPQYSMPPPSMPASVTGAQAECKTPAERPPPAACECPPLATRSFSFRDDLDRSLGVLRDDAAALADWNNAVLLTAALGGALALRGDADDAVRDNVARHPERWGEAGDAVGRLGEAPYQVPVLLALYGYSLQTQDDQLHRLSGSLLSAYALTGLSTLAIKGIADTDRPSDDWNGGRWGFPSFHAASSFTIAAVLDEHYGPSAGLPAYAVAGLIGWSRIDQQDHDLSDVVFGAALGWVIGKSVASRHLTGDGRVRLLPYVHPTDGAGGIGCELAF